MNNDDENILLENKDRINVTGNDKSATLDKSNNLSGEKTREKTESEPASKKKMYIIIGVIVAILLVAGGVTTALVLTLGEDGIPLPDVNSIETASTSPINNGVASEDTSASNKVLRQGTIDQAPLTQEQSASLARLHQRLLGSKLKEGEEETGDLGVNPRLIPSGENNLLIPKLSYQIGLHDYHVAQMLITDAENQRYSPPEEAVNKITYKKQYRLGMLGFDMAVSPFSISFTDVTDTSNVLLTSAGGTFVFMDKYIQMDFQLASQRVYGLGERIHEFALSEGAWSMWAKGQDSPYDDGTGGKNIYGVHPFSLVQGKNPGDFIGIYFRNTNAQSPLLSFNDDGTSTLHYITTGGELEVYFFVHKSAKQIIQLYHNIIGKPYLPPFWALGWQQASWKYETKDQVETMIQSYADAEMPLETVYLDIPYMDNYADFTVDETAFPEIMELSTSLHDNNQRLVVILDAAISSEDKESPYYTQGVADEVFIMSSVNDGPLESHVWPKTAVFIDWFSDKAYSLWKQGLDDLFAQVEFDGLWIDMNEATTFCLGECPDYEPPEPEEPTDEITSRRLAEDIGEDSSWFYGYADQGIESTYFLPFISGFDYGGNLDNMSLSLNATHPSNGETEYNLHNLYGHMMSKTTNQYLTSDFSHSDERPFVLTRSSFAGTGQYSSHWLGDNWRDWEYMRYSIAGMMNFNMFGITHVGADVCGFFGEKKDDEMCARWVQLATFYPLARAHQNLTWKGEDSDYSEPYRLEDPWFTTAQTAMFDRLRYSRFMYTCMFEAHQWGGTCIDPLFYYYPDDENVYDDIEHTFMVGGAVKVSPVLAAGAETISSYFPAGNWVDTHSYESAYQSEGSMLELTPVDTVFAHLRPGAMVPLQDNADQSAYTTSDILQTPIDLLFNRDDAGYAEGSLFLDDGLSQYNLDNKLYEYYTFALSANAVNFFFADGTHGALSAYNELGSIMIANAEDFQNSDWACYMDKDFLPTDMSVSYDSSTKVLSILPESTLTFNEVRVVYFGGPTEINLCAADAFQYSLSQGSIDLTGSSTTFSLEASGANAGIVGDLSVTLEKLNRNIVRLKWARSSTVAGERTVFTVPEEVVSPVYGNNKGTLDEFVEVVSEDPLVLSFKGIDGTQVMDISELLLSSWLNIAKFSLYQDPNHYFGVMGLGERVSTSLTWDDGVYAMYNRDATNPPETGETPGNNIYGTHPFFMFKTSPTVWTGVYSNTLQPQDWYVKNDGDNSLASISSVAIGGVGDLFVINGQDPRDVVADYHNFVVGRPTMPPVFALGWNQCRWGYADTQALRDVVQNYEDNGIPLDTQWSDIDYLDEYKDFEIDLNNFADLGDFVDELHDKNMYYVPIIDAGIAVRAQNYDIYSDGVGKQVFILANSENSAIFQGEVWPNEATYVDWWADNAAAWWQQMMEGQRSQVHFDGLWLDMNEASNFCVGPCRRDQVATDSVISELMYVPSARSLNIKSISVDAVHANGALQIDVSNLFATEELKVTHEYFGSNNERTYIISRSNSAGIGKYGANWLGDNFSTYYYLSASMPGIMAMNMFGVSLTGTDICGFLGDTNPELCLRWTMVGSLFPFARNHNDLNSIAQEPYVFKDDDYDGSTTYMDRMRDGIINRYHFIKYYYTQLFLGSLYGTGQFFRPLFYEYPEDEACYSDFHQQALVGPALMLLGQTMFAGLDTNTFYIPKGIWCDVLQPTMACINNEEEGTFTELSTQAHEVYVMLGEGHVIPMQDAAALGAMKTYDLAQAPVDFHINGKTDTPFNLAWYAQGSFINDDGVVYDNENTYNHYTLAAFAEEDIAEGQFRLRLKHTATASSLADSYITGCAAVNANDVLGDIYLYNADVLGYSQYSAFDVNVYYVGDEDTAVLLGDQAAYDATTMRVVWSNSQDTQICMPNLDSITFTPVQA